MGRRAVQTHRYATQVPGPHVQLDGTCLSNHRARTIRLNTELVKKPKDLLEYVVVHEMLHLMEPTHNERFLELMSKHYPAWREARAELNELPLAAAVWNEQGHSWRQESVFRV